ncbi:MAG: Uma2 family endonuclease [Candidatus Viridilinea halotolerans]|uniref:Uma2 family endonuclease n=1 Tax=Candidatus Viridilinea halotolerans TaxID=2491704 RepID=A0A426U0Q4_9CHLR|nr:MAG: Uma2 family endonuclease [Candidatus Viridilinea halotolerans]
MSAQPATSTLYSEEVYLAFERASMAKHDFLAGEIVAMTGGTVAHNLIAGNLFAALHQQLRGSGCRVFNSAMRVHVATMGSYTYPDLSVVCGALGMLDERRDTLTNPVVLVEVLSPATERYDRGMKFQHYRTLASLQEYLLLAQDRPYVEHFTRQADDKWLLTTLSDITAELVFVALPCRVALGMVYEDVEF